MLNAFREWCDRNPKPALGIGGGLLLIVVILFVRSLFGGPNLPVADSVRMVCVQSGKVFTIDREDINMFPMTNPKTGNRTLVPITDRNGHEYVPKRFAELITDQLKDVNEYIDPKTLEVKEKS